MWKCLGEGNEAFDVKVFFNPVEKSSHFSVLTSKKVMSTTSHLMKQRAWSDVPLQPSLVTFSVFFYIVVFISSTIKSNVK